MLHGVRHAALMHSPQFRCRHIVSATNQGIVDCGKRTVIEAADALKPPLALVRSGQNKTAQRPDEGAEEYENKSNKQERVDPTGQRRQDIEKGERQKQTSNADSRPQGGPQCLPGKRHPGKD